MESGERGANKYGRRIGRERKSNRKKILIGEPGETRTKTRKDKKTEEEEKK